MGARRAAPEQSTRRGNEERHEMWIGLFAVVLAVALGFGVAAFVMQPAASHP